MDWSPYRNRKMEITMKTGIVDVTSDILYSHESFFPLMPSFKVRTNPM